MKVAIACATLGLVERGGEIQLCELALRLAKRGHEVFLYCGAPLDLPGVTTVAIPRAPVSPIAPARVERWWFALQAYSRMWRLRPDVVIPITPPIHEQLARLLRGRYGTRIVSLGLGGPDHDRMRLAQRPDVFFAPSPRAAREAKAVASRTRIEIMTPGVDLEHFSPDGDATVLDGLSRPIVGVVGALIPCKRVELAIESLRHMPKASLLIIGKGSERARLETLARPLGDRVRFVDGVPAREMPRYYRAMDVLCFPADPGETFGMVTIEAMACGRPVVATDDEVRRWILGTGGLTCDVTRSDHLAAALLKAVEVDRPSRAARAEAERFSWDLAAGILDSELSGIGPAA